MELKNIFHVFNIHFLLLQKVAEISNVQIFVTDFCIFLQKVTENVIDFQKISSGIFLNSYSRLPPCI